MMTTISPPSGASFVRPDGASLANSLSVSVAVVSRTVLRIAVQLLPAQTGDYVMLISALPLASLLPDWSARLIPIATAPRN